MRYALALEKHAHQGPDPRALPQHRLLRRGRLRRRGRVASLLLQARGQADPRRGRDPRRRRAAAGRLRPHRATRSRRRTAVTPGAQPHGRARLHHAAKANEPPATGPDHEVPQAQAARRNGCTTSYAPFFCDYVYRVMRTDPAFGSHAGRARGAAAQRRPHASDHARPHGAGVGAEGGRQAHPAQGHEPARSPRSAMVRPSTGEIVAMAQNRSWGIKGAGNTTYNFNVGTSIGGSHRRAGRIDVQGVHPRRGAARRASRRYEQHRVAAAQDLQGLQNCKTGAKFPPYRVEQLHRLRHVQHAHRHGVLGEHVLHGASRRRSASAGRPTSPRTSGCTGATASRSPRARRSRSAPTRSRRSAMAGAYARLRQPRHPLPADRHRAVTDRDGKDLAVPTADCTARCSSAGSPTPSPASSSQVIDGPLPGRTGARRCRLGRDAAGKTGTTNASAAVWFVGFTPDLAAAVATYDPRGAIRLPDEEPRPSAVVPFAQVFGSTLPGPDLEGRDGGRAQGRPRDEVRPASRSTASASTSRRRRSRAAPSPVRRRARGVSGSPAPAPSGSAPAPSGTPKPSPQP